jgi:RNA polymerase sigma-70 factor (ECF subfamily)
MTSAGQEVRWVVRAQSGDVEALDALLRAVQGPLYGHVLRLVGDPHLAGDALQDVFVLILRNLRWLREPRLFRPWAYRIASRQALQCLKRERRHSGHGDEALLASVPAGPEVEGADPELLRRLPGLLGEVSPASRAVLSLHYFEGLTLQETADVLEISLAAVKSRLAYGLSVLRKKLGAGRE